MAIETPSRPPAAPGGGWDQTARAIQDALTGAGIAGNVQVTNVPGAGGTIGLAQFVQEAKGDPSKLPAIKAFLDFAYSDKYQLAFANEYLELPGTTSAAQAMAASNPTMAPFVAALPNAVQYSNDPVWAQVKTQIQQTIGTAVTSDPQPVLAAIQTTAERGE